MAIKIQEKYRLSDQYTPKKLLDVYKDSLLLELKNYSIIEYTMFRKAGITFEKEDIMVLTVEDTMVNRDRTAELKRVIEKVFAERCGLPVEVRFAFVEPQGSDRRKQIELKMEREAQAIYWQNHREELEAMGASFSTPGSGGPGAAVRKWRQVRPGFPIWTQARGRRARPGMHLWPRLLPGMWETGARLEITGGPVRGAWFVPKPGKPGQNRDSLGRDNQARAAARSRALREISLQLNKGRKGWGRDKDSGFGDDKKYSVKRSNNPDVLYGRDFEDEPMEIEKIDGEIGEVTLRGKVLTCENRELRSGKFILTFDVSDFTDTITVKMFIRPEIFDEVKSAINPGMFIKVKESPPLTSLTAS